MVGQAKCTLTGSFCVIEVLKVTTSKPMTDSERPSLKHEFGGYIIIVDDISHLVAKKALTDSIGVDLEEERFTHESILT